MLPIGGNRWTSKGHPTRVQASYRSIFSFLTCNLVFYRLLEWLCMKRMSDLENVSTLCKFPNQPIDI